MFLHKDYSALETSFFELIPKILQNSLTPVKTIRAMSPLIVLISLAANGQVPFIKFVKLLLCGAPYNVSATPD